MDGILHSTTLSCANQYILSAFFLNIAMLILFSLPSVVKLLKKSEINVPSRFKTAQRTDFRVTNRQVLGFVLIIAYLGISLVPAGMNNSQNPLFPFMVISEVLNPILSPATPFLLALACMWLLVVAIAYLQKRRHARILNVEKLVRQHLQQSIIPPRQVFMFLLLLGITTTTLLTSLAQPLIPLKPGMKRKHLGGWEVLLPLGMSMLIISSRRSRARFSRMPNPLDFRENMMPLLQH